jgi:hemin uptake protein HemP
MDEVESQDQSGHKDAPEAVLKIDASTLFGTEREIVIVHDGTRYRLRITRKNRLILQK